MRLGVAILGLSFLHACLSFATDYGDFPAPTPGSSVQTQQQTKKEEPSTSAPEDKTATAVEDDQKPDKIGISAIRERSKAPAPTPDLVPTAERKQTALDLIKSGDVEDARKEVSLALKSAPSDPQLVALSHLLAPARSQLDAAKLKAKAQSLMEARAPENLANSSPILASPLAWGAAPAAAKAETLRNLMSGPSDAALRLPKEALLKMKVGDFAGAEQALTDKLAKEPDNWLAYRFRALARRPLKNLMGAYDDASKAIALNPKDAPSFEVRALTLIDMDRAAEAVADADRALAMDPHDARALAARAVARGKLGQLDAQLADLKEAALWDPSFNGLYHEALIASGRLPPQKNGILTSALPYAAGALGLVLFAFAVLNVVRLGNTAARHALRAADREPSVQAGGQPQGFRIVRQIGQGGMGIVYEAVDETLQRTVALKKMRDEIANMPRERRRFLREARTVAALRHPNIVEIYSVLEEEAGLFLVFEHVQGEDLGAILSERKKLPVAEALGISRQIALAIDYAHEQKVIHQDLKPSNVMISGATVKVMDFGIARGAHEALTTQSRGEVMGTPAFMAPEHEQGSPCPQSDLFSLAVCCYELLSGKSPFPGGYQQKLGGTFEPLSLAAGLPDRIDPVFRLALSPEPGDRQPDARTFVAQLEKALLC